MLILKKIMIQIFNLLKKLLIKEKYSTVFKAEQYFNKSFNEELLKKNCEYYGYEIREVILDSGDTIKSYPARSWKYVHNINIKQIY